MCPQSNAHLRWRDSVGGDEELLRRVEKVRINFHLLPRALARFYGLPRTTVRLLRYAAGSTLDSIRQFLQARIPLPYERLIAKGISKLVDDRFLRQIAERAPAPRTSTPQENVVQHVAVAVAVRNSNV